MDRLRALTNSDRKRKKVVTTAGLQKHSKESEGDMEQRTLFHYKNTAPVINRLQGLRECVVIEGNREDEKQSDIYMISNL